MNALDSSGGCCGRICWVAYCWNQMTRDDTRFHVTTRCSGHMLQPFWGTLTILPQEVTVVDGTNLGIDVVKALKKPLLVLAATWKREDDLVFKTWLQDRDVKHISFSYLFTWLLARVSGCVLRDFVIFVCFGFQENEIHVLNINGPRESSMPGIHDESHLVDFQQSRKSIFFDPWINHMFFLQQWLVDQKHLDWTPHETGIVRMQAIRTSSLEDCCLLFFWAESKDLFKTNKS